MNESFRTDVTHENLSFFPSRAYEARNVATGRENIRRRKTGYGASGREAPRENNELRKKNDQKRKTLVLRRIFFFYIRRWRVLKNKNKK